VSSDSDIEEEEERGGIKGKREKGEGEEEEEGWTKSRDVKVLEDCLRDDFRRWMMKETLGNSRPIAEATAQEHVMSMNNLLRRVLARMRGGEGGRRRSRNGVGPSVPAGGREEGEKGVMSSYSLGEKEEAMKVLRTKRGRQALREEGAKLTYGRVTAFKYFCKYMGMEEEEEGGREGGRDDAPLCDPPPPPPSPSASGGGGRGYLTGLVLLKKEVKRGFKKWLMRRGGGHGGGREVGKETADGYLTVSLYILHKTFNRARPRRGRDGKREGGREVEEGGSLPKWSSFSAGMSLPPAPSLFLPPSLPPFSLPSAPTAMGPCEALSFITTHHCLVSHLLATASSPRFPPLVVQTAWRQFVKYLKVGREGGRERGRGGLDVRIIRYALSPSIVSLS